MRTDENRWLFIPLLTLAISLLPFPSEFYYFSRVIIFGSAAFIIWMDPSEKLNVGKVIAIVIAVLFNPFFPIFLHSRASWILINIFSAAFFLLKFYPMQVRNYLSRNSDKAANSNTSSESEEHFLEILQKTNLSNKNKAISDITEILSQVNRIIPDKDWKIFLKEPYVIGFIFSWVEAVEDFLLEANKWTSEMRGAFRLSLFRSILGGKCEPFANLLLGEREFLKKMIVNDEYKIGANHGGIFAVSVYGKVRNDLTDDKISEANGLVKSQKLDFPVAFFAVTLLGFSIEWAKKREVNLRTHNTETDLDFPF